MTSIETQTAQFSPVEYIDVGSQVGTIGVVETTTQGIETISTVLPIPPVHIEVIPNPDIQNVLDVNSIYLSKVQELSQLYQRELYENVMTNSDLIYLVKTFTIEQISSSNFNEFVLLWISCFNG